MIDIGIILSDSCSDRPCLGLALEIEDAIKLHPGFSPRLIDLQDYQNDQAALRDALKVDGLIFVAQEQNFSFPDCISKMIGDTYPTLKNMPTGLIVNAEDQFWSESIGEKLQKVLLVQDFIVFHKKLTLLKIHRAFNSSYELIDQDFGKKLKRYIEDYLSFIATWVPKSQSELLTETL